MNNKPTFFLFDLTGGHSVCAGGYRTVADTNDTLETVASVVSKVIAKKYAVEDATIQFDKFGDTCLPLFLCLSYDTIRSHGFNVPREFVFEVGLLPNPDYEDERAHEPERHCEIVGDSLLVRLNLLEKLDLGRKISKADIRDWCSGAFRRFLFNDANVHGTSGTLNLSEVEDANSLEFFCKKWFGCGIENESDRQRKNRIWLRNRFECAYDEEKSEAQCKNDPLFIYRDVLKQIFLVEFDYVKCFFSSKNEWTQEQKEKIKSFFSRGKETCGGVADSPHLPFPRGLALRFVSPRDRISILVVDDDAEKEVAELRSAFARELEGLFNFQPLERKRNSYLTDNAFIGEVLRAIKDKASPFDANGEYDCKKAFKYYDGILLDLSLGEEAGSDLMGYQLIKFFRQFMPAVPLIIYSEHEDMGHIARAFQEGARWFLKKSEAKQKLARHFISLKARREWKKEWKVLLSQFVFDVDQRNQKFNGKFLRKGSWQYLTLKSLESLPGHYIRIKPMGGGISSAATFMAQKGVIGKQGKGTDYQSPVIIKIDSIFNTRMEYERYFRFVRPYIANEAGRVERQELILNAENSAIVYTFAGRRDASHELKTLDDLLRDDLLSRDTCDYEKYRKVFDSLFDEIIKRLHRVSPEAEFRDSAELPSKVSMYSDYPNHTFGELVRRCDLDRGGNDSWFFSNYTYRMPIERSVSEFEIDTNTNDKIGVNAKPFQVYGVYKAAPSNEPDPQYPYRWEIECQHYDTGRRDYEKVVLRGDKASFYARFRKYVRPGMVLPVVEINGGAEQEVMSWGVKDINNGGACACLSVGKVSHDGSLAQDVAFSEKSSLKISPSLHKFCQDFAKVEVKNEQRLVAMRDALQRLCDDHSARFVCPVGIVHGDLNFKNIMIDSRVHPPKSEKPDITRTLTDVWLIDFARTRRDVVSHDFNVAFTATLPLLFQSALVGEHKEQKDGSDGFNPSGEQVEYLDNLNLILEPFLRHVLFDAFDSLADSFVEDRRLVFVYRILRRIHHAAIEAGLSEDMYLLTTALSCFYSFKIYYKQRIPEAANALVLAGLLCAEKLLSEDVAKKLEEINAQNKSKMP